MSDAVIKVNDVRLEFPLVRFHARGVKELFLSFFRKSDAPPEQKVYEALRGISLEVNRGEIIGIIGRNGSGKSTLLRVICGIYAADHGSVETKGRISSLLELGSGFRPELTGYENIKLNGAIMGFSPEEMEARMDQIIEFSGLDEFINQPLKTYSSGMKARLGFAVASTIEPDILIVDEALSVGDAPFRKKSMERIEQLVAGDTTVIIVSHNLGELRRLCSRLVLLQKGEVVMDGDVEAVLAKYAEMTGT